MIDANSILRENKCVIFIDALDEIASNTEKELAFDCIQSFSEQYPSIKLICTSRPSDFYINAVPIRDFVHLKSME